MAIGNWRRRFRMAPSPPAGGSDVPRSEKDPDARTPGPQSRDVSTIDYTQSALDMRLKPAIALVSVLTTLLPALPDASQRKYN